MARDLSLSEVEHEIAKTLKKRYGFKWPLCAHIAKDAVCVLELHRLKQAREDGEVPITETTAV